MATGRKSRVGVSAEIPKKMERHHQRELVALLKPIRRLVKELKQREKQESRQRMDSLLGPSSEGLLAYVTSFVRNAITDAMAKTIADKATQRVSRLGNVSFRSWVQALGLDVKSIERSSREQILAALEQQALEHARLIKNITDELADQIAREFDKAIVSGERATTLSAIVEDRLGVAESRARLIARDQLGKAQSRVAKARQESLVVTRYRWKTSGDERVRQSHQDLDGKIFSWDSPPSEGHLGEAINCRCVALPVFDD